MGIYALIIFVFAYLGYTIVLNEQKAKDESGWVYNEYEKKFEKKFLI